MHKSTSHNQRVRNTDTAIVLGNRTVVTPRQLATERSRIAAARNTMASSGFRALRDLAAVDAASDRFDRFVAPEPNTGCFLWCGAMDRHGYGYFRLTSAVVVFAHRYAFVRANRHIEEGQEADHVCFNRWCVRVDHLQAVSRAENLRRRDARLTAMGTHNLSAAHAAMRLRRAA
jgi:HNH endonuclease